MADCQCQCGDLLTQMGLFMGLSALNNAVLASKPGSNLQSFKKLLKENEFDVIEIDRD